MGTPRHVSLVFNINQRFQWRFTGMLEPREQCLKSSACQAILNKKESLQYFIQSYLQKYSCYENEFYIKLINIQFSEALCNGNVDVMSSAVND